MEQFTAKMQQFIQSDYVWIINVFVVVLGSLLLSTIANHVVKKLIHKADSTHNFWDDALFQSARKPLVGAIWVWGLSLAAQLTVGYTDSALQSFIPPLYQVSTIFIIAWFLVRFIKRVERNCIDPGYPDIVVDETTAMAIGKLLRISVIITAVLVGMQSLGYSISGVLAFGGIGGLAVGFAAKDLLANFFGGLMIYLDRPFKVGDWVRSPDQDIEGTVEDIGWRLTRIRTFDKRPLYVPNSTFTHISVENPSRMSNRRIYETVGIRYDDALKMGDIVRDVRGMLENHPEIDTAQTLIVNFNKFSSSSLDFFIYTFTKTTEWVRFHEIKQDVLLKIVDIVSSHGAEMAFPTSTVHVQGELTTVKADSHQ